MLSQITNCDDVRNDIYIPSSFFRLVIIFLGQIPVWNSSSKIWNAPIDFENGCFYFVEMIGSIKNVNVVSVCFFFFWDLGTFELMVWVVLFSVEVDFERAKT
jgi:hypothetical protein